MRKYLYSGWDSTQKLFNPDPEALMDALGLELMSSGDVTDSIKQLQRKGMEASQGKKLPGIEEILEQLHQTKQNLKNQTQTPSKKTALDGEQYQGSGLQPVSDHKNPKDPVSSAEDTLMKLLQKTDRGGRLLLKKK